MVIPINENITLNYIPMDKLKTTAVSLYIHRPLKRSEASFNAMLPHVLKRGCRLCDSSQEVAKYLENLYGAKFSAGIAKRGDDHLLCFDFDTISDKYAPGGESLTNEALRLMLSMVFEPLPEFSDDVFEAERKNSITKIENIINDKRVYALYRCQEEMAKGDSFCVPRLGYVEDMKGMTKEALMEYYRKMITESVIDVFVCGDTSPDKIAEEIKRAAMSYTFKKAEMPKCSVLGTKEAAQNVTEKQPVTQGKLAMGFTTGINPQDDDYFALVLANAIFGGGAQSKLFNNVREKLSLAYYAGSMLDKYKGIMLVNSGIEFKNFDKAREEILIQLEEMKKGNITDLEIESSKNFIISSLQSNYDDQHGMISFYLGEKIGQTSRDIEECKRRILALTKEDAARVMRGVRLDTVYFLTGGDA